MILKQNKIFALWLNLSLLWVLIMIAIGGFTRLTESGLSITKWDLFVGIFPPLTQEKWLDLFKLYQQIPEYYQENIGMDLAGFKQIFWLEYLHRLFGRITALFIIIPAIYFAFKSKVKKDFIIISFLLPLQGLLGWFMVKSGLSERTDVSHFRLALHLGLAFIIFLYLVEIKLKRFYEWQQNKFANSLWLWLFFLIFLQIIYGAFVAGLKAGYIYNSYPLMGNGFIPSDFIYYDNIFIDIIYNPAAIQFIHRIIAFIILTVSLYIFFGKRNEYKKEHMIFLNLYLSLIIFQFALGVLTLISVVNIYLAVLHQVSAVILLTSCYLCLRKFQNE